jgi:peptidoglycan/LPS O-acetylase OafA/YrhL
MGAANNTTTSRIPALDFTKGVLVLFMVLYHWLNYFVGSEGDVYKYLRFLTPSFIFITGFLISHVHCAKYGAGNPRLSARLLLRGLKILGLFILLNLLISVLLPNASIGNIFTGHPSVNLDSVFITGNALYGIGKATAFNVLVPISYLLLISALLMLSRSITYSFYIIGSVLLLCMVLIGTGSVHSANLELLTIGLLGLIFGYTPNVLRKVVEHPYAIILAYAAYLAVITVRDVSFPLQVVGVCLTLMLIYIVGAKHGDSGRIQRHILVLGKYSLFAYVSQIAILQLLHRTLAHGNLGLGQLLLSLLAGLALTVIVTEIVDRVRPQFMIVDVFYRTVFA